MNNTTHQLKQQPESGKNQNGPQGPVSRILSVVAWLLVLAGAVGAISFFSFTQKHEETNDAQVDQYITPVASRISGYIQEVRFEENQPVHKGDTLVIIDNREYASRLAMAQADYQNALQTANVSRSGVATTEGSVAVRNAQLAAVRVQVWKAEQDYQRYKALLAEDAVTEQQFEQAKAAYDGAQAQYREMQEQIRAAALSTHEAESKATTTGSVIALKKAALDNAALYLSYTVITAPYEGWAGRKTIQPGQLVREGQTLVSVVSREKWVTANFKETQIENLKPGKKVVVKVDAAQGKVFRGTVSSLSAASGSRFSMLPPDNSTGNFVKIEQRVPVRIDFDPGQHTDFLRAGMNAEVTAPNKD